MTTAPRLTIDLTALKDNWKKLASLSGDAGTAAVIKADGYGLGIEPVCRALYDAGARTFFVAMAEEGLKVRNQLPDAEIFVLNGTVRETVPAIVENNLIPVLSSVEQIAHWISIDTGQPCAVHVDTGMNRLGLTPEEALALAGDADRVEKAGTCLLMSHLASADEPSDPMNQAQLERFRTICEKMPGIRASFANSAGIFLGNAYHFDLTRPGIAMYGAEAVNGVANPMQVVVQAEARILQIRSAKKGETIGYGASHVFSRDSRVAIVSAGYADGYLRSMSGSGVPLRADGAQGAVGAIGPYRVPVLGRVSMDLTAFDVTDIAENELEQAEWIELFGSHVPIDEAARAGGSIGYELLTNLGSRYQRHYMGLRESD